MQKIMIIEDEPSIRDELALLLGNEGYTYSDYVTLREMLG